MDDEGDGAAADDDPDDARHDDGDGGDDFPLREGISPAESPHQEGVFFSLSFSSRRGGGKLLRSGSPIKLGQGGKYAEGVPEGVPGAPRGPPGAA